jgi:hypothetical protein
MTAKHIDGLGTIEDVEVIVDETATSKIVRTSDGRTVNIETSLPDVRKGHKGKLIDVGNGPVFVREPYVA